MRCFPPCLRVRSNQPIDPNCHSLGRKLCDHAPTVDPSESVSPMAEYDTIAQEYQASKHLAFREYAER